MANKKEKVTLPNLSKEQIDNIKNYKNSIKIISDYAEGVRKLPGNFLGNIGTEGWKACGREIIQNAIDECLRTNSPANHVWVTFDERNQMFMVEDNGRGLPHGMMIECIATERSSSNYDKEPGQGYTSGAHGLGSGVAMALSEKYTVESYVLGEAHRVEFNKGKVWKYGEKSVKCPPKQGTYITLIPDYSVLGNVDLSCKEVYELLAGFYTKMPIGHEIDFIGIDKSGSMVYNEKLINRDGILTDLMAKVSKPLISPICYSYDNGIMKADVAFTYDIDSVTDDEDITSFANFTNTTDGGTHVDGFLTGLCKYLKDYMNKIYLGEKSKLVITNADVKNGLKCVISAAHINPIFKGQFKGKITNEEFKPFIENLTAKALEEWAATKPAELQKVAKYIKDLAEIRNKTDLEKVKLTSNYQTSALGDYPKKFVNPAGNKNLELFIVEGVA